MSGLDDTAQLILKILYPVHTRIKGSTMFQKIMYILKNEYENRIPELRNLHFKLHYYGPYCREISNTLDNLTFRGLLSTDVEQVIDYLRYKYSLTEAGREHARRLYELDDRRDTFERMARRIKELNHNPLQTVILEAYKIAESKGL